MTINLREFLARQLNDHTDSTTGVVQKTYAEWGEAHLSDAINLALCYVYSLVPQHFSSLEEITLSQKACVIELCDVCNRFMGIASLNINGVACIDVNRSSSESNSLSDLFSVDCVSDDDKSADNEDYSWEIVDGSNCIIKFDKILPSGTKIEYTCSTPPQDIDSVSESIRCEYGSLIADYALWWLFRTDSESRSNLDRARLHFDGVKHFVTTKLLLEFSLNEDDYNYGRRKVDD